MVGHGRRAQGTLHVLRTGQDAVTLPAGGRGTDQNGDGRIGSTEGVGTRAGTPLALISNRDGLRQTTADLMQLARAIRRGVDVDGDGHVDLDRERIVYFGQSFGGMYGTLLMAVDPLVRVGVLNVAGGPIVEIARQSPVFRGVVVDQLKRRQPPLMNGDQDFAEAIPLPGEAPVLEPAAGALDIQAYLYRAEWLSQPANPVAFAPYLKEAPLPGRQRQGRALPVGGGDRTVPNPTTVALLRAGVLQAVSSLYRHDPAGVPERFRPPARVPRLDRLPRGVRHRTRRAGAGRAVLHLRRPPDRARTAGVRDRRGAPGQPLTAAQPSPRGRGQGEGAGYPARSAASSPLTQGSSSDGEGAYVMPPVMRTPPSHPPWCPPARPRPRA